MPFFPWLPLIIFGGLWSIAVDSKPKESSSAQPQGGLRPARSVSSAGA